MNLIDAGPISPWFKNRKKRRYLRRMKEQLDSSHETSEYEPPHPAVEHESSAVAADDGGDLRWESD